MIRTRRTCSVPLLASLLMMVWGCASLRVQSIPHDPQQARLERLLASIAPHTDHPEAHYWVRIIQPTKAPIGLWVLPQRHIYLAKSLVDLADDSVLTALLAHGVAHHELHHQTKRSVIQSLQYVAFLVGGSFVPGLGFGWFVAEPAVEAGMGFAQEFSADPKTLGYLQPLGYSEEDYIHALEFLTAQHYFERAGKRATIQRDFSRRIAALRKRRASQPPSGRIPGTSLKTGDLSIPHHQ